MVQEMTTFHIMVNDEYARNSRMIDAYENEISKLPKGSLQFKSNGHYYLSYRNEEGMVVTQYVKDSEIDELRKLIEQRKAIENTIKKLIAERKEIEHALKFSKWR